MKTIDIENPFGRRVYYKEKTESTMIDMASLKDPAHGTIVMAGYQSRGRGRGRDRKWESDSGKNLLFTISLRPEEIVHPLLRIPLICGLALTDLLRDVYNLDAKLKWPNDVLVDDKKIAGILCEYRNSRFNLGMGINCNQSEFDPAIEEISTSLDLQAVTNSSPRDVLEKILIYLKHRLENAEWKNDVLNVLYKLNEEVLVYEGLPEAERSTRLKIVDLNDDGFLIARELPGGDLRQISAGEIRFSAFN